VGGLLVGVLLALVLVVGISSAGTSVGGGVVRPAASAQSPSPAPSAVEAMPVALLVPQLPDFFDVSPQVVAQVPMDFSPAWGGAYPDSPLVMVAAAPPAQPGFTPPMSLTAPPRFTMIPFVEAHWQGLEMIELTPALAKALGIDPRFKGIIADDVTPPADACGFFGADLVVAIDGVPTPDLKSFIDASTRVQGRRSVPLTVIRQGQTFPLALWALQAQLGNANGETAPMIPSGSVSPHAYQGACTGCHRIGTKGQLPVDQGDLLAKAAPPIRTGQLRPHRDRGECVTCHQILP
jgi:hypothetical protein